jgi:rod shape-determining protein MreD
MSLAARHDALIEVHKYRGWAVAAVVVAALFFQGFLPKYIPHAEVLELPLLVTVYFALGRRNASSGLLLGLAIGLLQDAISHLPFGVYGISLTVVGYCVSWTGAQIAVEHPASRFGVIFVFYHLEQVIIAVVRRYLLGQPETFFNRYWLVGSVVASVGAVLLFPQLDRLRKS